MAPLTVAEPAHSVRERKTHAVDQESEVIHSSIQQNLLKVFCPLNYHCYQQKYRPEVISSETDFPANHGSCQGRSRHRSCT